jgi:hypothetical protein
MGNSESPGTIHIDLDSPSIQAGDSLTGTIHLLVSKPISASLLSLELLGNESTQWYTSQQRKKERIVHEHKDQRVLLSRKFTVHSFPPEGPQEGQYSFPFVLDLPDTLAGSFLFEPPYIPFFHDGQTRGVIQWVVMGRLEDQSGAYIVSGGAELHVAQRLNQEIAAVEGEITADLSTWYFFSQGRTKVKVEFSKDAYVPGETARVLVNVDNSESALEALGIRVRLTRYIILRERNVSVFRDSSQINSASLPYRLSAHHPPQQFTLELMIPTSADVEQMTSVASQLIDCRYEMTAEVEMNGWFTSMGQLPKVSRVMCIYPPQVEKVSPPEVEEWNPTVMPVAHLDARNP